MAQKAGQSNVWSTLSALDAFPKVNEDFFKKTMSGGGVCCPPCMRSGMSPWTLIAHAAGLLLLQV
jgi:hypothetical protein